MGKNTNIDFELLSFIVEKNSKNTSFSQREIANALKISLGMTNNILKKVLKKGLLLVSKIDGKRLSYVLTPSGSKYLYSKSVNYLKSISKNAYQFKDIIFNELKDLKTQNYKKVILLGNSGLDFIIEYCAIKNDIEFEQILAFNDNEKFKSLNLTEKTFYFVAENIDNNSLQQNKELNNISISLDKLILDSFISGKDG